MGTAGGVKTTTIAILILSIAAYLQGKKDVEVYGRKIRSSYIRSAQVVVGMAVSVLLISVLGIFAIMPDAPFVDVLYELTSAIGTVGLSRGLTAVLNTPGQMDRYFYHVSWKNRSADTGRGSCIPCAEAN